MLRGLIKALLLLLALLIIALFVAIDLVDYTPYFESDYYQITKERLDQNLRAVQISEGQIYVGFSKVNITK